ncbi:MAG TPA: sigma-70 family RNA polymerase sigma factor [Woeseiaceae bacterium]|nr:sigma-70 family RNA polymerase sigma factor [Woeseiaceae bacterium]
MGASEEITGLLQAWRSGDDSALERLAPFVYDELHRLAGRYMRAEREGHTLQATALVNEAFVRLAGSGIDYQDRKHFFVVAARLMRRVLVDHARARNREKRGDGALNVTLTGTAGVDDTALELPIIALDEALTSLADSDPRSAKALELVYFGGLSVEEAAQALEVSQSTAYEDVRFARAWVRKALR